MSKPKVIAIVGPTASGKSALAVWLAKQLQKKGRRAEIISADSRQVYKGLDIGTGKVTKKEMAGIPHHLLSVASPKRQFTVDKFVHLAEHACSSILQNTGIPIVVGGTGLYTDMLLGRMSYPAVPPNPTLRKQLESKNPAQLLAQLRRLDPRRAQTIEPHHKRRIIRAIEIAKTLGKTPPSTPTPKYDVLWLGVDKPDLEQRIAKRLHARLKLGMVAEAKRLHKAGLSYKRMDELGLEYRHLAQLLQGKVTKEAFEAELTRAIVQYAKRQRRWFKRNNDIVWVANKAQALRLAKAFLSR